MTEPPLLLHVYATFAVGGPQVRFAAIANRFGGAFRHAVVAMDGNTACRERLSPELDVSFPAVEIRKGDTLGNVRRFRRVLKTLKPDALVTSNWGSIEWAMANMMMGVRHIHVEDGFGPEERTAQLPRRVLMRRMLLRNAIVAVPSRRLWEIATGTWRLSPRRLRYIANGIDVSRFTPAGGREPHDVPVIGTVAALRPEKNLGRLLRAFAMVVAHAPCRLVIAGDGTERAGLENLAAALGVADAVTFTGHVGDTPALYAAFDLFALSSDTEQMPLSVLEAMAAGLPVAATDVGDVRFMVAQDNAASIVPLDDAALADSLTRLLGDHARRRRMGAANRAKAEAEFDQEAMFEAWRRLFTGALGPCAPATPA